MWTTIRHALVSAVSDTAADDMHAGCRSRRGTSRRTRAVPAGGAAGVSRQRAAGSSRPISFVLPASQPRRGHADGGEGGNQSRAGSHGHAQGVGRAGSALPAHEPSTRARERRARPAARGTACASARAVLTRPAAQDARIPVTARSSRAAGPGPAIVVVEQRQRALDVAAAERRVRRAQQRGLLLQGSTRSRRDRRPAPRRRAACSARAAASPRSTTTAGDIHGGRRPGCGGAPRDARRGRADRRRLRDVSRIRRRRPRRPPTPTATTAAVTFSAPANADDAGADGQRDPRRQLVSRRPCARARAPARSARARCARPR